LGLSQRTLNTLKRANINKVGEILERGWPELRKIRNFGDKAEDELRQCLGDHGLVSEDQETLEGEDMVSEEVATTLEEPGDREPVQ
jgi:DNA-directed RNA polymerase alpha subunit